MSSGEIESTMPGRPWPARPRTCPSCTRRSSPSSSPRLQRPRRTKPAEPPRERGSWRFVVDVETRVKYPVSPNDLTVPRFKVAS